jgi:hypothetical protein
MSVKNLANDLTQIENVLGAGVAALGGTAALVPGSPLAVRIAGLGAAALAAISVCAKQAVWPDSIAAVKGDLAVAASKPVVAALATVGEKAGAVVPAADVKAVEKAVGPPEVAVSDLLAAATAAVKSGNVQTALDALGSLAVKIG